MIDFENYTLLKILKKCIIIMKIQGLFFHRVELKNQEYHSQEADLRYEENKFLLKQYLAKNDLIKKTSTQNVHLIYCIALLTIKYASFILLFSYFYYISDEITKSFKEYTKHNGSYNNFKYALFQVNNVFFFLLFFCIPIYFLIVHSSKNGFYKSVLSYEYVEEKIKECFREFNIHYADIKPLSYSNKKTVFNILFFLFAFILISLNSINSLISLISLNLNYSFLELLFLYLLNILQILILIDWATILYFISANLVLIQIQVDAFYRYLTAFIQKNIQNHNKVDIESFRSFYDDLYEHVKCCDQWLCYYFGIIYLFTIPFLCVFIYTLFIDTIKIELALAFLPAIIIFASIMLLVTILAILVNIMVWLIFKLKTVY
jgi:hypothetical protein